MMYYIKEKKSKLGMLKEKRKNNRFLIEIIDLCVWNFHLFNNSYRAIQPRLVFRRFTTSPRLFILLIISGILFNSPAESTSSVTGVNSYNSLVKWTTATTVSYTPTVWKVTARSVDGDYFAEPAGKSDNFWSNPGDLICMSTDGSHTAAYAWQVIQNIRTTITASGTAVQPTFSLGAGLSAVTPTLCRPHLPADNGIIAIDIKTPTSDTNQGLSLICQRQSTSPDYRNSNSESSD